MKEFSIMFAVQVLNHALLCWNYRAIALGMIPTTVASDLAIATVQFKLIGHVARSESKAAFAGYVVGGAVGSAIAVWLTNIAWGKSGMGLL